MSLLLLSLPVEKKSKKYKNMRKISVIDKREKVKKTKKENDQDICWAVREGVKKTIIFLKHRMVDNNSAKSLNYKRSRPIIKG